MLRLEFPLPDLPDEEGPLPELEIEVRRDEGPDVSAPVGDGGIIGEPGEI